MITYKLSILMRIPNHRVSSPPETLSPHFPSRFSLSPSFPRENKFSPLFSSCFPSCLVSFRQQTLTHALPGIRTALAASCHPNSRSACPTSRSSYFIEFLSRNRYRRDYSFLELVLNQSSSMVQAQSMPYIFHLLSDIFLKVRARKLNARAIVFILQSILRLPRTSSSWKSSSCSW